MMLDLDYVKTLLYVYPKMEAMEEAISVSVENKAALSFKDGLSALGSAERIVEEMAAGARLARVRGMLERALLCMTERERFLLEYKYFRRRKELAEGGCTFACSERTYYRNQQRALQKFARVLNASGYGEREFLADFSGFKPYRRVYDALKGGRESAILRKRTRRGIRFAGDQKSEESSLWRGVPRLPRSTKAAIPTTATQRTQITVICTGESVDDVGDGSFSDGGSSAEVFSR